MCAVCVRTLAVEEITARLAYISVDLKYEDPTDMNLDVLKTATLLTVTSVYTQFTITILFVLVLYPAVFIHTVCNAWFDSQALVLTAAKKKKKKKKKKTPPFAFFPISYFLSPIMNRFPNTVSSVYVLYSYS